MRNSKLLVIVGETASGKSDMALQIAQRFNGEIICADSWTVRREVTIGTAKPSLEEQALVPHHLLDIVGPCEDFTAAVFQQLAQKAIDDILNRGKLPVMVGGSGLYIDGVIYNYGFLEAGDRQARRVLNELSIQELLGRVAEARLSTDGIDIRNKRRLIRLLETEGAKPTKKELRDDTFILGLNTEKELLSRSIAQRVDMMLAAGLEHEVQTLSKQYGWDCEALKGIGYWQWKSYFSGTQTLAETQQKIIKSTQDLAKRQRTWFKRNKSIHWLITPVKETDYVDLVTTFLDNLN